MDLYIQISINFNIQTALLHQHTVKPKSRISELTGKSAIFAESQLNYVRVKNRSREAEARRRTSADMINKSLVADGHQ